MFTHGNNIFAKPYHKNRLSLMAKTMDTITVFLRLIIHMQDILYHAAIGHSCNYIRCVIIYLFHKMGIGNNMSQ